MCKLLNNKTDIKAIDCFNAEYAQIAIEICSLLSKFQISISYYSPSNHKEKICLEKYDIFGYYMNNEDGYASSTYAEIVINEETFNQIHLTKQEIFAALAHEIGHIMLFFNERKEQYSGQGIEVYCDHIACRIGLGQPLKSLLNKLVHSKLLPQELVVQTNNRIKFIDFWISDYDNHLIKT